MKKNKRKLLPLLGIFIRNKAIEIWDKMLAGFKILAVIIIVASTIIAVIIGLGGLVYLWPGLWAVLNKGSSSLDMFSKLLQSGATVFLTLFFAVLLCCLVWLAISKFVEWIRDNWQRAKVEYDYKRRRK